MKTALVHYWLVGMRGGEKVLEVLCELFPEADVFTLVVDEGNISEIIRNHRINTSFLQSIGGRKYYQKMLPLMPFALEAFDLTAYDLIISSEAGPAKAIVPRPDALHICYCHSPMRYIWDLYPQYRANAGFATRAIMSVAAPLLRQWDVTSAARVDHFIANSNYVAKRIAKYYRREASVINPPVDLSRFQPIETPEDFYLCAGQITPYKKIEIAVEAFTRSGLPLVIAGSGVTDGLRKMAGPNISFVGPLDDVSMADYFARCRALVFPGIEDFGIVPLEVMASGRPVIAHAAGGALETVRPGLSGLLFSEQTPEGLMGAVREMEKRHREFSSDAIRRHAASFDRPQFKKRLSAFISEKLNQHFGALPDRNEGASMTIDRTTQW